MQVNVNTGPMSGPRLTDVTHVAIRKVDAAKYPKFADLVRNPHEVIAIDSDLLGQSIAVDAPRVEIAEGVSVVPQSCIFRDARQTASSLPTLQWVNDALITGDTSLELADVAISTLAPYLAQNVGGPFQIGLVCLSGAKALTKLQKQGLTFDTGLDLARVATELFATAAVYIPSLHPWIPYIKCATIVLKGSSDLYEVSAA